MPTRSTNRLFANVDWITVGIYLALILMGWGNIYAAVYNEDHANIFDISQKYGKQMLWICTAFVIAIIILIIDSEFYTAFSFPVYAISILSLLLVLVIGKEVKGSKSWIYFGNTGVQPAEFAKFAVNLALAKFLSRMNIKMTDLSTKIYSTIIILLPMLIIILQHETGVALVYAAYIFVLYREGLSGNFLLLGVSAIILFIVSLLFNKYYVIAALAVLAIIAFLLVKKKRNNILVIIVSLIITSGIVLGTDFAFRKLEGYQKTRINVFLGKEMDKNKTGYNVNQAKIAIGSGGFLGKGYLEGTQTKFDFVPEQDTDFIFCTVGEEWGFLGSTAIIGLFITLIIRIIFMAERQRSPFSRIYGYGVASIFFFHLMINVGMTIGLAPVIGIPLPFFSYGGSSLWSFTILLFIFIKLDSHRLQVFR
ncbi:MAG: rod shape-determining protein RodA [Bacteroidetes bacterium]|nr:rod shape-determining protein RodA [Bacteroidota bacterium]